MVWICLLGIFESFISIIYIIGRVDLRFYRPDILPAKVRAIITAQQSYYPSDFEDEENKPYKFETYHNNSNNLLNLSKHIQRNILMVYEWSISRNKTRKNCWVIVLKILIQKNGILWIQRWIQIVIVRFIGIKKSTVKLNEMMTHSSSRNVKQYVEDPDEYEFKF